MMLSHIGLINQKEVTPNGAYIKCPATLEPGSIVYRDDRYRFSVPLPLDRPGILNGIKELIFWHDYYRW